MRASSEEAAESRGSRTKASVAAATTAAAVEVAAAVPTAVSHFASSGRSSLKYEKETSAAQPRSKTTRLRVESRYEVRCVQRGHQAEPLRERIR